MLACCVLAVQEQLDASRLAQIGLFAELGLGGDLRPGPSVAAVAEAAGAAGLAGLVVADGDLRDARAAGAVSVAGLRSLSGVATLLSGRSGAGRPRSGRAVAS